MTWQDRRVDTCGYRSASPNEKDEATCRLLQEIAEVNDDRLYRVSREACEACCQSFPPSATDPNPVIASLLFQVARQIATTSELDEEGQAIVRRLTDTAVRFLPLMQADEAEMPAINRDPRAEAARDPLPPVEVTLPCSGTLGGRNIHAWSVGVTTSPRRLPTLDFTLESLRAAGWPEPRLFIDGDVVVSESFADLDRTIRYTSSGAFPSYHLALLELYHRNPDADAYMMVQDDVLVYEHPGLREYLERALWPCDGPCIVSLFCSQEYAQDSPGWCWFQGQWLWGAQLFVFSPTAMRMLLSDGHLIDHRTDSENGLALIDHCIGKWAVKNEVPIFFPTPSLAQHIGHVSTLWPASRIVGGRRAGPFAGDVAHESKR